MANDTRFSTRNETSTTGAGEAGKRLAAFVAFAGALYLLVAATIFVGGRDVLRAALVASAGVASFAVAWHVGRYEGELRLR